MDILDGEIAAECLGLRQFADCATVLRHGGFSCPTWDRLATGCRPEDVNLQNDDREPGLWSHGWQYFACDALERKAVSGLHDLLEDWQVAILRSQSGVGAGDWLLTIPANISVTLPSDNFLISLRRRMCLPLPLGSTNCKACRHALDDWGHHLSHARGRGG